LDHLGKQSKKTGKIQKTQKADLPNMKMKYLLPAILCGVTISVSMPAVLAQDAPATTPATSGSAGGGGGGGGGRRGGGMSVDDRLAALTKELTLTADQQAKIKPILQDETDKMKALFSDNTVQKQDRQTKMKDIRDTANTAIKALLTPDQVTKFDAANAARANGGGRRGNGGGGGGGTGGGAAGGGQ
jgi:periplasmic protein CpxP/Spy